MLQQTTVTAVISYFERWMARFPTLEVLATAAEQDVLSLWQGLGYYGRARNLRRAASAMKEQWGGNVPRSVEALRRLPGVGDYTAAAIASFAFDATEPVIDANIARVLVRLRNWRKPVDDAAGRAFLKAAATRLLPEKGGRLHNSALMELGALDLRARGTHGAANVPFVRSVPRSVRRRFPSSDREEALKRSPRRGPSFSSRENCGLSRRPVPRWRGLWFLPRAEPKKRRADHVEVYSITRFRVTMQVFVESPERSPIERLHSGGLPPMPSPHRRAVAAMLARVHTAG